MKKLLLLFLTFALFDQVNSQVDIHGSAGKSNKEYRETAPIINDLVHTKLEVNFDYDKAYLNGKAWLTLQPYFYATDSLTLDAKGMDIKKVQLVKGKTMAPLKYTYDGMQLFIGLDKEYKKGQQYTVFIDYVAKPNEYKGKGSAAITDAKGLYFINPSGEDKEKPVQIWTQGETEATSVWCPTIDDPNQKTTQEILMTVPSRFVSLSNGKLVKQTNNANGTRTDHWKMDQPHSPYLFFMGVGDYAVIKDSYKGKEVSYYVEKEYAPVARKIFGHTPEMIAFYSKILGVDYPWVKYSQIVGRDYVSGAMENTTATLHQESAQQDARELVDENKWESVIAHELFHHWFGDLVTAESWSNLTINESFANYSEYLWMEHKYGKDAADAHLYSDMQGYLFSKSEDKDLVRFYYEDKEAMFDAVSYNKGGAILHMLRNHVGDSAFFQALNRFLVQNSYKAAEAHQLRLSFEETTGRDLNWFWNQWYFGAGHPELDINYSYDEAAKQVQIIVKQTQESGKVFRLPVAVDIYSGNKKTRHQVVVENQADTFRFSSPKKPDLVNFDADKILVGTKKENKTLQEYIHQYKVAGTYLDRREAIEFVSRSQDSEAAISLMKEALKDPYYGLRRFALQKLDMKKEKVASAVEPTVLDLVKNDPKSLVRSDAVSVLAQYNNDEYTKLFSSLVNDSSYSVSGNALKAVAAANPEEGLRLAKKLSQGQAKGKLVEAITSILIQSGDVSGFPMIAKAFKSMPFSQEKFNMIVPFSELLAKMDNTANVKEGVDLIVEFRNAIPEQYGITPVINNFLKGIIRKKETAKNLATSRASLQEQIDYIQAKIGEEKKGF